MSWWEVNAPRRLAFGVAADEYDLIRPGYPAPLVDAVLAHCGGPGVTAGEAGGGMMLLARRLGYVQLAEAVRFTGRWERGASLRLRAGDPSRRP